MEALKIAFDATVIGSLALPWVVMCVYLFAGETNVSKTWQIVNRYLPLIPPALGGVLLFVLAYVLGSAVSRVSGDFFNDEDLRVPITEDSIRASVYCQEPELMKNAETYVQKRFPELNTDQSHCTRQSVQSLFQLQEAALTLEGTDKNERLIQLRAQISVLRGGAFDGFVFCALCVFGWCANQPIRRAWIIPTLFLAAGVTTTALHLLNHWRDYADPPFMEFTFLTLGVAGLFLVRRRNAPKRSYGQYGLLAALLSLIAYFGWWWSEVLYDQEVLHTFAVLSGGLVTK